VDGRTQTYLYAKPTLGHIEKTMRTIIIVLLLSTPLAAAEPKEHRDLAYAEPN
jgi:hypothetical protein